MWTFDTACFLELLDSARGFESTVAYAFPPRQSWRQAGVTAAREGGRFKKKKTRDVEGG